MTKAPEAQPSSQAPNIVLSQRSVLVGAVAGSIAAWFLTMGWPVLGTFVVAVFVGACWFAGLNVLILRPPRSFEWAD